MNTELPFLERASNYVNPRVPRRCVRPLAHGETPAPGAHLITPWLGFAHHGIYVGEGSVVHYGALMYDIIRKPVEEVTLEGFAQGRAVFVVDHADRCLHAHEVIRRARSRLGEKKYRLWTNNCEHFVEWCLHDQHRSFQVDTALSYPRLVGEKVQSVVSGLLRRLLTFRRAQALRIENRPAPR
jgi:hypothetical protein